MTTSAYLRRTAGDTATPTPADSTAFVTTLGNGRFSWQADIALPPEHPGLAPDPHELLDSALAACTTLTLELYIRRKQLAVTALQVDVIHTETRGADGRVHYALERRLHIEGALSDDERARLLEIAGKCPIHRVLEGEIHITSSLVEPAA